MTVALLLLLCTSRDIVVSINYDATIDSKSDTTQLKKDEGLEPVRIPQDDEVIGDSFNLIELASPTHNLNDDDLFSTNTCNKVALSSQLSNASFTDLALSRSVEVKAEALESNDVRYVTMPDSSLPPSSPSPSESPTSSKPSKPQPAPRKGKISSSSSVNTGLDSIKDEDEEERYVVTTLQKPKIKPRAANKKSESAENLQAEPDKTETYL